MWVIGAAVAGLAFVLSCYVDGLWDRLDDAYITYSYAKRLAAGQGYTFSPGTPPTYGTTTVLWTLLLAAVARLGVAPHVAAVWLTSAGFAATAVLMFLVGTRLGGLAVGVPVGLLSALNLAAFFRSGGMETALLTALIAALALVLLGRRRRWVPGILLGLLVLTRPDAGLLAALVLGGWALRRGERELLWTNALAAGLVYLPWAVYVLVTFHDLVPCSLRAKHAMPSVGGRMNLRFFLSAFMPGVWGRRVFWVVAAVGGVGAVATFLRQARLRPVVLWALLYWYVLAVIGHAPDHSWYYVPPLAFTGLLVVMGVEAVTRRRSGRAGAVAYGVAVAFGLIVFAYSNWVAIEPARKRMSHLEVLQTLALRVRELSEPDDLVASEDVGKLAYWSERRILDLRALNSPEVLVRARARNMGAILRGWEPDFVLLLGWEGIPEIEQGYVARYRVRYWNDQDYVIWERASPTPPVRRAARSR